MARISPWLRSIAVLSILALASCGGGGGGSAAAPPASATPPGTSTPAPVTQAAVQRTDAAQSLQMLQASRGLNSGGVTTASVARRAATQVRRAMSAGVRHVASVGTCTSQTVTSMNQTSSTTATITVQSYYDQSCTSLEGTLVWNLTVNSPTSVSGPATMTRYAASGSVVTYETLSLSMTFTDTTLTQLSQLSVDVTSIASSVNGPSIGSFGIACGLTGASSLTCGLGAVANMPSLSVEQGFTLGLTGSESASSVQATITAQAFQGGLSALTLSPGTFPAWTISGGALLDSASATVAATYASNGTPTSLAFTMTDSQDQATVVLVANSSGIAGTIARTDTGATVATFTIDALGNGTISYSNGTQGQIEDYLIVS
ncbi:hypothetical protein EPN52_13670 [bacterium]|nr:MAG: hypothetical protein EPN52_13670 [bacterium]